MQRAWAPPVRLAVPACALLLFAALAHAAPNNTHGICSSLDIRNNLEQFKKLDGCRIIEGQLSIVLMERTTAKDYMNMRFPNLREVTGYVLIYRTKGLRNLGDLFPNLTVVRGMELFKDFALVIFDNANLEALGLRSLMAVQKGGVRIERNDQLCYVNTVDWTRINTDGAENIIRGNYDTRFCGLCPNAQSRIDDHRPSPSQCPIDPNNGRLLCWDNNHCQTVCSAQCGSRGCLPNGTCCHLTCLGGCDGPTSHECHVCRNFSLDYGDKRVCVESCPAGTFEIYSRCVTEEVCRAMPPPPTSSGSGDRFASRIHAYKIHNNKKCEWICPAGFMEVGGIKNATCVLCPKNGGCERECDAGKIDSVAAAKQYTGCTHLKGKLEISIRAGGGNTIAALEKSLGEIRQITGCLQVTRSYPLVSLMFLKNLKTIVADKSKSEENKGQVLHILNNPNLELLWDWKTHGSIDISGGTIYIHQNPKLCYNQLLPLKNMTREPQSNFTDIEVSEDTNGNQASCLPGVLNLTVTQLRDQTAVLSWNTYCPGDLRKLLGYSLYYIATETNVTLYQQRDACSDIWNVLDIPVSDSPTRNSTAIQDPKSKEMPSACSENDQPMFSPLPLLVPFARYAAYVKTYTTLQDKEGAQSSIVYFRILPSRPSPPQNLGVEHHGPDSVTIHWSPPSMPNGTIILYSVEVQANSYNRDQILAGRHSSKDTCSNPTALANLIASRVEEAKDAEEEKVTGDVNNGTCACKEEKEPSVRFDVRAEEERMDSIHFENELQNLVYKKTNERAKPKISSSRMKRAVGASLNNMLVKLTKSVSPQPGVQRKNESDDEDCVKSQFYDLDGATRSVTVKKLRHFTWYTVNVWACRAQAQNETKETYDTLWCSERAFNTFLTHDLADADTVKNVRVQLGSSNKTNDVNVSWDPPEKPNGFVVAYSVLYTKIQDDNDASPLQNCITAEEFDTSRGHVIRGLNPGNYSIRVTPITVKGQGNVSADVYIDIPASKQPATYEWIWGVVGGCLVMVLVLTGVIWYVRRGLLSPTEAHKLFATVNPEYVSTVYVPDEWEVPRASIEFIRELGQGSFGMVYEGLAKGLEKGKPETRCAVKTVNEHATDRERIEFLNEASVMKAFDTYHVVRLMGVVSRGQPTLVVMELMECGDLKTYLRSHRPDAESSLPKKDSNNPPTLQNILQMAIEIADGMAYLSAKKFVHRDLAARNCMVAGDLTVKVGDFGMTRDIYETDYYRKGTKGLLPVRWMSPESLKDGVFSSNSDVWSYGVVLWEMATLAMQPYQGLSNEQVLRYVVEGGVMERPEHCPDRLYDLMRACWSHRPASRPSFLHLVADLAPSAQPHFRHRSFFHSPLGREMYQLQRNAMEEEQEIPEVNVGAVATGSGSNLFGVSGRLASWVRELSSLRSRGEDDAAAEPLRPLPPPVAAVLKGPNGVLP